MSTRKNLLPPFVPVLKSTLATPAWKAMSYGARVLYISLKARVPHGRNIAYLSYRAAAAEIGCSKNTAAIWYQELEHYSFIELARHGYLGVDGKGKSPHWRLTELGQTSKASAGGLFEPPTNDFLKWDGTPFRSPRKNRLPSQPLGQGVPPTGTVVSHSMGQSNGKVSQPLGQREGRKCPPVGDITSYHCSGLSSSRPGEDPSPSSGSSSGSGSRSRLRSKSLAGSGSSRKHREHKL